MTVPYRLNHARTLMKYLTFSKINVIFVTDGLLSRINTLGESRMSQEKLASLKIQYTNNAAQVGELTAQSRKIAARIDQLLSENDQLSKEFELIASTLPVKEESSGTGESAS